MRSARLPRSAAPVAGLTPALPAVLARSWTLFEDGRFEAVKQPPDVGKKKPSESVRLENVFIDVPGNPSARKDQFNVVPMAMGKSKQSFFVDTDKTEADTQEWTLLLSQVIERLNGGQAWARSLSKMTLQVWPEQVADKESGEEYTAFMFRISRDDGEWGWKQRYSGLQRWHVEYVVKEHGKGAPKFPGKHAVGGLKGKGDKFTESRRLDLQRYFIELLGFRGFMESDMFDILLDRQRNQVLGDKKASSKEVEQAVAAAATAAEDFDESTLEAPDEWVNLHRAALPGAGRRRARLLSQEEGSPWLLSDEQLDIAAYELIFLTVGTSASLLSPKERGVLESVQSALSISRRKLAEISQVRRSPGRARPPPPIPCPPARGPAHAVI